MALFAKHVNKIHRDEWGWSKLGVDGDILESRARIVLIRGCWKEKKKKNPIIWTENEKTEAYKT